MANQRTLRIVLSLAVLAAVGGLAPGAAAGGTTGTVLYPIVNVRSGPGTDYAILTTTFSGATFPLTGRSETGDWAQVCCVGAAPAWIYRPLLAVAGAFESLPVVQAPARATPTPTPAPASAWRGEYFANRSLAGSPVLVRDDPTLSFRWAGASPGPNVPGTDFSARWTRTLNWEEGDYNFWAEADDGVRVYLDGWRMIDGWREGAITVFTQTFANLEAGNHTVTVEYFQASGESAVSVWWQKAGLTLEWKGEYFNDVNLNGPTLLVRNDPAIDFNWGLGSPAPNIPIDNWSVRWTRPVELEDGDYVFFARTSDGVRIYLDNWLALDEWHDSRGGYVTYQSRFSNAGGGWHTLTVEYYARGGIAYAMVWWERAG